MRGACSTYRGGEKFIEDFVGKPARRLELGKTAGDAEDFGPRYGDVGATK
jgi:hypothetical protein